MMTLQVTWFFLIAVLIAGYALLDGFDLGVGNLHLLTKGEQERGQMFYAIGPFWDANQVWLLTGGGAIFAAFPMVYATVFSGFYMALMLLLFALIFRAVSIEFRHQLETPGWKKVWDWGFSLGSIVPSILLGVAVGNIIRGIPLDSSGNFTGTFLGLLNPYSLLVGLLSLAMFTVHGAAFLVATGQGELPQKARRWAFKAWLAYAALYIMVTAWSYNSLPWLFDNFTTYPLLWLFPLAAVTGIAYFPIALTGSCRSLPLISSGVSILGVVGIVAGSLFPYLVPASNNPAFGLTVFNSSSSELTLTVMLVLALIGMPLVLLYTGYIYYKFTGKTSTSSLPQGPGISG